MTPENVKKSLDKLFELCQKLAEHVSLSLELAGHIQSQEKRIAILEAKVETLLESQGKTHFAELSSRLPDSGF